MRGVSVSYANGFTPRERRPVRNVTKDAVMGIVFFGMFGLGLAIFTKVETDQHLNLILVSNVLAVTVGDLL